MAKTNAADTAPPGQASEKVPYEAARDELLEVVRQLEAGGLPLERSLQLWERGEELALVCQEWLDGARERLAARRPAQPTDDTDTDTDTDTNTNTDTNTDAEQT